MNTVWVEVMEVESVNDGSVCVKFYSRDITVSHHINTKTVIASMRCVGEPTVRILYSVYS
jgi:hypothetical protein